MIVAFTKSCEGEDKLFSNFSALWAKYFEKGSVLFRVIIRFWIITWNFPVFRLLKRISNGF